ncbi:MAG: HYR domain-containing protein [Saprospiraceae bacterium]|nr:HYR domain-containing protein [Saprospiraceae bacterium]
MDVIGKIGQDPGVDGWVEGAVSSKNNIIRRLATVQKGDNDPTNTFFGLPIEWESAVLPNFEGFGTHENGCLTCDLLVAEPITTPELCAGTNDGKINIAAQATLPIQYSIDGGTTFQDEPTFEGLAPGAYTILIKVQFLENCQQEVKVTLPVGPAVGITRVNTTRETCPDNNNGTIQIFATFPSGTLQYSIDGGQTFQASNSFDNLDGGNYDIVVMADNIDGCIATTSVFIETLPDTQAPTFTCPADMVVNNAPQRCDAPVVGIDLKEVSDNCDANPSIAYVTTGATQVSGKGDASGIVFNVGTTIVTYTVTDRYNNSASCSFTVTVEDGEAPVAINCPADILITNANDFYREGGIATWTPPVFEDNCTPQDKLKLSNNLDPGFLAQLGYTLVQYFAEDEAGNEGICEFAVIVREIAIVDPCTCLDNRSAPKCARWSISRRNYCIFSTWRNLDSTKCGWFIENTCWSISTS